MVVFAFLLDFDYFSRWYTSAGDFSFSATDLFFLLVWTWLASLQVLDSKEMEKGFSINVFKEGKRRVGIEWCHNEQNVSLVNIRGRNSFSMFLKRMGIFFSPFLWLFVPFGLTTIWLPLDLLIIFTSLIYVFVSFFFFNNSVIWGGHISALS